MTLRLLLVDDHPLVRDGQRARLQATSNFEVVGEAGSVAEALALLEETTPDIVLVDIELRGESGLAFIESARGRYPSIRFLVVSMHNKPAFVHRARSAGARGYVLKDDDSAFLTAAVEAIAAGRTLFSPNLDWSELAWGKLTPRERQVACLLAKGASNLGAATQLGIGERAVETHRAHAYRKLSLHSPVEILEYIRKNGITDCEGSEIW